MSGFSDAEVGDIHSVMTVRSNKAVLPVTSWLLSSEVGLSSQAVYDKVFEAALEDGLSLSHLHGGVRVYDTGSSIAFIAALAGYSIAHWKTIPMFRDADWRYSHVNESVLATLGFTVKPSLEWIQQTINDLPEETRNLIKQRVKRIAT